MQDSQLSASSVWEWSTAGQDVWAPTGARLKKMGLPWAPAHSDQQQWLQIDFRREKKFTGMQPKHIGVRSRFIRTPPANGAPGFRAPLDRFGSSVHRFEIHPEISLTAVGKMVIICQIMQWSSTASQNHKPQLQPAEHHSLISSLPFVHPGITTTGSTRREYQYYVSAYRVQYSNDGQQWYTYREANSTRDKVIQAPSARSTVTSLALTLMSPPPTSYLPPPLYK